MSRSGYSDDYEPWDIIRWRGAVASALRGNRGQTFLREMIAALDALPGKVLIQEELEIDGQVCALGSVGKMRGMNMGRVDPEDPEQVARVFGISVAMSCEIMYENDDGAWRETPEERWSRMRKWAESHLKKV